MAPLRLLLLLSVAGALLFRPSGAAATPCAAQTFSGNRLFATCLDLPHLSSSLHWSFDPAAGSLALAFVAPPPKSEGWAAWAINPAGAGMIGSQALIAFQQPDGKMGVKTYNISAYAIKESPIAFPTSDLAAESSGGEIRMFARIKLPKNMTVVNQVWQVGSSVTGGVPAMHALGPDNRNSMGKLDLIKGLSAGTTGDSLSRKKNIHGVLNAVSWGILLPMGAIIARYLKTFKSADPAWFYLHVTCQLIGYGIGVAGWATGLNLGSKSKGITYTTHRNIGITLFSLATLQIFALLLRPGKDHKYRFYWNIYHHLVGYAVIILGVTNVFEGLHILNTDHKWTTGYTIAISILGGIALLLEAVTWLIFLRRKSDNTTKPYSGSNSTNGHRMPLSA